MFASLLCRLAPCRIPSASVRQCKFNTQQHADIRRRARFTLSLSLIPPPHCHPLTARQTRRLGASRPPHAYAVHIKRQRDEGERV